ncbi:energy-coupling factor ABC transporter permease [Methanobrevibacter filiformis]|uniref:Cobalt transport protein CbiM n=1 Tax=Methanobrevibacter filiformis TaxID=55758 RepID=A0A166F4Z7_9EURY|nr:energy-coupling factor ABC transporter permease [Methanobrevibacter filiformis]KZX17320.1 cobalt transport protein CbiM precursor [Methanobrevibacter filiformis]
MHLPDGMIPLDQSLIYWIIVIICLGIFLLRLSKLEEDQRNKRLVLTAVLTATTIVVSTITIPSPFGIPMHFFLIPLVVIVLGPFSGTTVSFLALIVQCLIGEGGLTVIGANTFTMGVILSLSVYAIYKITSRFKESFGIFLGTFLGIIIAAFTQILILIIADVATFETLAPVFAVYYLFIGIIEGFITTFICSLIEKLKPEILTLKKI